MNYLSKNIRFLRKERKFSQQQLADALEVKRSNIAAYETKGVEPRLSLINEMASFFGVSLADLITSDLSQSASNVHSDTESTGREGQELATIEFELNGQRATLQEHAHRINQMLEGFRVFYEYKRMSLSSDTTKGDVDNFLVFVKHMHNYNKAITRLATGARSAAGAGQSRRSTDKEATDASVTAPERSMTHQESGTQH